MAVIYDGEQKFQRAVIVGATACLGLLFASAGVEQLIKDFNANAHPEIVDCTQPPQVSSPNEDRVVKLIIALPDQPGKHLTCVLK